VECARKIPEVIIVTTQETEKKEVREEEAETGETLLAVK
jgi:hypothetical protein